MVSSTYAASHRRKRTLKRSSAERRPCCRTAYCVSQIFGARIRCVLLASTSVSPGTRRGWREETGPIRVRRDDSDFRSSGNRRRKHPNNSRNNVPRSSNMSSYRPDLTTIIIIPQKPLSVSIMVIARQGPEGDVPSIPTYNQFLSNYPPAGRKQTQQSIMCPTSHPTVTYKKNKTNHKPNPTKREVASSGFVCYV